MPMTESEFKRYLLLYGTELECWPEDILAQAKRVQHLPVFISLMIEQQYIDETLLNNRAFEEASSNLANRIIRAASARKRAPGITFSAWVRELLDSLLPRPAFALATVLTLGILIGFAVPTLQSGSDILSQNYFEDDGAVL